MTLHMREGLLREALATLRVCGAGVAECVCWLTGPVASATVVDEVLHPVHTASSGGYRIDDRWLTETWIGLARERRQVRAQVHTHPSHAYHSSTDDAFPAVQTAGFLSLVIPTFAKEPDLRGAYLAELGGDGRWGRVDLAERLVIA